MNTRSGRCLRSSSVNMNSCCLSPSMFQEKIFNLTVVEASVFITDLSVLGSLNLIAYSESALKGQTHQSSYQTFQCHFRCQ